MCDSLHGWAESAHLLAEAGRCSSCRATSLKHCTTPSCLLNDTHCTAAHNPLVLTGRSCVLPFPVPC